MSTFVLLLKKVQSLQRVYGHPSQRRIYAYFLDLIFSVDVPGLAKFIGIAGGAVAVEKRGFWAFESDHGMHSIITAAYDAAFSI